MPASASRRRPVLIDTSVAVALTVADHEHHDATSSLLAGRSLGLAGHAAFETFSVLTRMPPPARRSPATVGRILAVSFPHTRFLSAEASAKLAERVALAGIAGGAVYDALVGGTAVEHGMTLLTRGRRAVDTYRALGVVVELLG